MTSTTTELRLEHKGSAGGLQCVAIGMASFLAGIGVLVVGVRSSPLQWELWLPMTLAGGLIFTFGLLKWRRTKEECVIDFRGWTAQITLANMFRRDEWQVDCDDCRVLVHQVELHRRGPFAPKWKGHALCFWHHQELIMTLAIEKKQESCLQLLSDSGGVLDRLYQGEGEFIIANE